MHSLLQHVLRFCARKRSSTEGTCITSSEMHEIGQIRIDCKDFVQMKNLDNHLIIFSAMATVSTISNWTMPF